MSAVDRYIQETAVKMNNLPQEEKKELLKELPSVQDVVRTKKIIDAIQSLKVGDDALHIVDVAIDGNTNKVEFAKGNADAENLDNGSKTITITRKDIPADAQGLASIVNSLSIKQGADGKYILKSGGTNPSCDANVFESEQMRNCGNITPNKMTVIEQLQDLTDGDVIEIASISIDKAPYEIKFEKGNADAENLDNGSKTITITRKDIPADAQGLASIVNSLSIKQGADGKYILKSGGSNPSCDANVFESEQMKDCGNITPNKMTVIEQLQDLTAGDVIEIASIGIDKAPYEIKFEKGNADTENIDNDSKTITITRKDIPANAQGLASIVNSLSIKQGADGKYILESGGTNPSCSESIFESGETHTCGNITPNKMTVIEQLQNLQDTDSLGIANVELNTEEFGIKFTKLASGNSNADKVDNKNKIIDISRVDIPANAQDLANEVNKIALKYYSMGENTYYFVQQGGQQLGCDQSVFVSNVIEKCAPMSPSQQLTIVEKISHLTTSSIAKIKVDGSEFTVTFKKSDSDQASINSNKKNIDIESSTIPSTAEQLTTKLEEYCITKEADGQLQIGTGCEADSHELLCEEDIFSAEQLGYCAEITF